ncbi:MAG: hypothetical protein ACRD2N_15175 [Vicinamibacterales bacterium]
MTFTMCVQDSQDYGSDYEHMVSRVFFDLVVNGKRHPGLHADLKQVVGSNYETGDIEVGQPVGYRGPFNHIAFRAAAERYFRSLVGSSGSGIRIQGASNIRMPSGLGCGSLGYGSFTRGGVKCGGRR